jgi:hypothetical protein
MIQGMFGCGSGGGGSCGQVEPCGANLVGNWTVSGACLNAAKVMQIGVDDGGRVPLDVEIGDGASSGCLVGVV